MIDTRFEKRILLGRLLTRSGDQAWDFAVPFALLIIFPGQLRIAAIYYLVVRLANVLILPKFASIIDRINRYTAARIGIIIQFIGVLCGWLSVVSVSRVSMTELSWTSALILLALVIGGILSGLGSSFMDIAIANDLVPSAVPESRLNILNSRLRQIDLATEVGAPILAGLLLATSSTVQPLFGFALIAGWNLISFFPEYLLLRSIFRRRPDLKQKTIVVEPNTARSIFDKLTSGWRTFFREPVSPAVAAYALLWLSVLSPHGVLLTAFLKDGWHIPEWTIGIFRSLGAVFGLVATLIFPRVVSRFGLVKGSGALLWSQAVCVGAALSLFLLGGQIAQIGFLGMILLSRVGLYSFSLGEMQIRQVYIRPEVRGQLNGFATALTGLATLALYGAGALLPATKDFKYLIFGSVAAVWIASVIYSVWARLSSGKVRRLAPTIRN